MAQILTLLFHLFLIYTLQIQDPVSPVDLTFTCSSSSSSYNLTATCRTDNISISLRCDYLFCNKEEAERNLVTKSGSSLYIYKLKESVVCSHSNQVSKVESKENIENRCPPPRTKKRNITIINITRIILAALLVVVFILTVVIRKCKRKTKPEEMMYEFPE
ncbi:uncharacterized protein LOC111608942 isoform X2 [Xiphophorus maculatus]|uniref:uncharacterized protein LOC111608942 isoform X2 n=1 Tax=Xiphophorus maculatus TaxID=8083 RepID=UPI000C6D21F9|nr:uncharacterized protein LOC111608942 isoform X2 [Xiphophorus maculatus]